MFATFLSKQAYTQPEWPAAEPLLYTISQLLSQRLPTATDSAAGRSANSLSIHLFGLICTAYVLMRGDSCCVFRLF